MIISLNDLDKVNTILEGLDLEKDKENVESTRTSELGNNKGICCGTIDCKLGTL